MLLCPMSQFQKWHSFKMSLCHSLVYPCHCHWFSVPVPQCHCVTVSPCHVFTVSLSHTVVVPSLWWRMRLNALIHYQAMPCRVRCCDNINLFTSPPDTIVSDGDPACAIFIRHGGSDSQWKQRIAHPTSVKQWERPSQIVALPSDTVWRWDVRRSFDIASKHQTCCIVVRHCLIG